MFSSVYIMYFFYLFFVSVNLMLGGTYLYIIKYHITPPATKIGISEQLKKRLKSLLSGSPVRLEYVYVKGFKNRQEAASAEARLHHFFDKMRMNGEVFAFDSSVAIKKATELYGKGENLEWALGLGEGTKIPKNIVNIEDYKPEFTKKKEIENFYKKIQNKFKDDKFRLDQLEAKVKLAVKDKTVHLYDQIPNPLSEIFYNRIFPISISTSQIPRQISRDNQNIKNTFFSEFLNTISDSENWQLREAIKFHNENKNALHQVGSGNKAKEWNTHRTLCKFRKKVEIGPNIMTIIDIYKSNLSQIGDDIDNDYPGFKRLQPPLNFSFGNHPKLGPTVNFWVLSNEWIKDAESFGRSISSYRKPLNRYHLGPLCWLFDYHGYAPFIHTIYKPNEDSIKNGIPFQIKMEFEPGGDFADEWEMYYHCYGKTEEASFDMEAEPDPINWYYIGRWSV